MTRPLSRRERQIMDILYRRGRATITEILADLADPPTDSAIRSALRLLEQKGRVSHAADHGQNVYEPTVPLEEARRSALDHVIETFFRGSREQALAAMIDREDQRLSDEELDEIETVIQHYRQERGRRGQRSRKERGDR